MSNGIETWLPLPDHPGYEVSDLGRVRSYRTRQGHPCSYPRVLSPLLSSKYPSVQLGRGEQITIHTLVLTTFSGARPVGLICRHLDGDPSNNEVTNLRWGTYPENYDDRRRHGTDNTGSRSGRASITEETAREIKLMLSAGRTVTDVAAEFNIGRGVVGRISSGRTWAHAWRDV